MRNIPTFEPPLALYRTNSYKKNVFLSLLEDWNNIDISTRKQHSREMFRQQTTHIIPPSHYDVGPIKYYVILISLSTFVIWEVIYKMSQVLVTLVRQCRVCLWWEFGRQFSIFLCVSSLNSPKNCFLHSVKKNCCHIKYWYSFKRLAISSNTRRKHFFVLHPWC